MRAAVAWTTRARAAVGVGLLAPVAGLTVALAPPASAHDELVSSSPDDGARVSAPRALTLDYSESLVDTGYRIVVRGPDGPVDGNVRLTGTRVVNSFPAPLSPGSYDVVWRVVSSDGHPISGRLSFTVSAAATASPTTGASATSGSPTSSATSSAPSPTVARSTPTAGSDGAESGRGGLVLGVALAAAVSAAVAAAVTRRVRGPRA